MKKLVLLFIFLSTILVGKQLNIPISGNLFYEKNTDITKSPPDFKKNYNIMHDAIPTWSETNNSWAILTDPTRNRYAHGILGDTIEATSITITDEFGNEKFKIELTYPEVFESRYVIWADTDGEGIEEITATVSDNTNGASIRVFSGTNGKEVAKGAVIGTRNRWQHMICWAPFTGSVPVLALVKTPHIGGILEFYIRKDDELIKITDKFGFSTHKIGSKNLFMAAAVDSNNDGLPELYLPTVSQEEVIGVEILFGKVSSFASFKIEDSFDSPIYIEEKNDKYWLKFGDQEGELGN